MKKYRSLIFVTTFPYAVIASLLLLFSNILGVYIFAVFASLIPWWFLSLAFSIVKTVEVLTGKYSPREAARASMAVKLIQIPAYVMIFLLGLAMAVTIFTYAFSIILIILDAGIIFCTGIHGAAAVIRCYNEGIISKKQAVLYGIMQFVYVFDCIFAVVLYIKASKQSKISE